MPFQENVPLPYKIVFLCVYLYIYINAFYLFIYDLKKIVREASHADNMGDLCKMEKNDDA